MTIKKLLIANRGEIAIRIARAAAGLGIETAAVYSEDDGQCLHVRKTDQRIPLRGKGSAAYLDIKQLVGVAASHGCDAVHPGYGFLAENAEFARACEAANLTFVGPGRRNADVVRRQGEGTCVGRAHRRAAIARYAGTH